MQPLTAKELDAFLLCASSLKDELGSLQRLAEPFVQQPIEAALLHFVYQQARTERSEDRKGFFDQLMRLQASNGQGGSIQLFPIQRLNRISIDHENRTHAYFAPILDLLEIAKSLR
mgnify:CR=1 FL=1